MTTEADTTRRAWDESLTRFQALRILFDADDNWGPLADVTAWASVPVLRAGATVTVADAEAELARHMTTIYDPLIKAGLALVRTPAPDLEAVRTKHEACSAEYLRLPERENEPGELFDIIRQDIARLTGIEA